MHAMIEYAKAQNIGEVFGTVLRENQAMLGLARRLGFRIEASVDDPEVVEVRLPLAAAAKT
jgi:acetyltransferase